MKIKIYDNSLEKFIQSLEKSTIYMKSYNQLKKKLLTDNEIKKEYRNLGPEFEFIQIIIKKRISKGLTQKELAEKIGTKQAAISRLESGAYNPTVSILRKVAGALDAKIEISIR